MYYIVFTISILCLYYILYQRWLSYSSNCPFCRADWPVSSSSETHKYGKGKVGKTPGFGGFSPEDGGYRKFSDLQSPSLQSRLMVSPNGRVHFY